jgi:trigger factor
VSVTVENLGPSKKLLRVEIEAPAVEAGLASVKADLARRVALPGFRPGKAPRHLIERTFADRIREEAKNKLINESFKAALAEHKFTPVTQPKIEEVQFAEGQSLIYTANLEIEPQFELPDYKGLPVRRENRSVTEEDLERAVRILREKSATFADVERAVQSGDFVVVNYQGTCDGKPITDTAPTARGLTQQTGFWLQVHTEHFIPGFTDQLIGACKGEKRTVTVTFPSDFVAAELVGKVGVYEVEIVQVKEKHLPAEDDALAKALGAENLVALREGVRRDLENELKGKQRQEVRNQLIGGLLGRVQIELPESLVEVETRGAVFDIVKANAERGVPKEAMDDKKNEIYQVAVQSARERLKVMFLLSRIARQEKITVTNDELGQQVVYLAHQRQTRPEKLIKEMQDSGQLSELQRQMINTKVLDFIEQHARVEEAPGGGA